MALIRPEVSVRTGSSPPSRRIRRGAGRESDDRATRAVVDRRGPAAERGAGAAGGRGRAEGDGRNGPEPGGTGLGSIGEGGFVAASRVPTPLIVPLFTSRMH
jgi:hypothetical protein